MVASKTWPQMMSQIVYHDFHPPLFYALTHYAVGALHWQVWNYRYLTAPFGLMTIVASWAIARRLFGDWAAAITAVLVAVEPSLIQWDRLYRMYSVMTALATLSWWLLLIAQEKTGRQRVVYWLLYGASAVIAPYMHYLAAVNVLCQGLYALTNPRKLWPVIAAGCAAIAALLPWAWAIRIQYPNGGYVAGTSTLPIYWLTLARDTFMAGLPQAWSGQTAFAWGVTVVALTLAVVAAWRWPRTILPFWLGVAAFQVVASLATGKDLVIPRYLLQVVPAFCIAAGGLVAELLAGRGRIVGAAAAIGIPALFVVCAADVVWDPYYQFPDWYLINLVVLQHERKDDAMLFVQGFPYIVVGDFTAFRGHPVAGPSMPEDLPGTFRWLKSHGGQRIWYIENQFFYPDPDKKLKAFLDRTRRPVVLPDGQRAVWSEARASAGDVVNVILYDKPAPAKRNDVRQKGVGGLTPRGSGLDPASVGH